VPPQVRTSQYPGGKRYTACAIPRDILGLRSRAVFPDVKVGRRPPVDGGLLLRLAGRTRSRKISKRSSATARGDRGGPSRSRSAERTRDEGREDLGGEKYKAPFCRRSRRTRRSHLPERQFPLSGRGPTRQPARSPRSADATWRRVMAGSSRTRCCSAISAPRSARSDSRRSTARIRASLKRDHRKLGRELTCFDHEAVGRGCELAPAPRHGAPPVEPFWKDEHLKAATTRLHFAEHRERDALRDLGPPAETYADINVRRRCRCDESAYRVTR